VIDEFERAFLASPRPSWIIDDETLAFLRVNNAACALYEWTRDEFLALTLRDVRPAEALPQLDVALATHADEQSYTHISRHRTKSGRLLDVEVDVARLTFEGRAAKYVIITDVTNVREIERRLRMFVEHSHEGMSMSGLDGLTIYMSPGGERLLGVPRGSRLGKLGMELMHPDDVANFEPIPPGETRVHRARVRHADGRWLWFESAATNLTQDPAVQAWVSNFRDVTARVEAEEALRRSEANFRMLAERAPTAIFVHREGKIVYMNPTGVAMLGYDRADQIVGTPIMDIVHPDDVASVRARMAHTAQYGGGAPGEARMRKRDGSWVVADGEGIVMEFDGKISHVVVGRDVTERRELYSRMALADRLLSVGTLAAGVAHEINNPLAYVSSNLELLVRELPLLLQGKPSQLSRPEVEELLAEAREGAARVGAIVRDLRALSRTDEGEAGTLDVAAVLASCVKIAHNEVRHRARVVIDVATGLPPVRGSQSRLGQVFLNLLVNAAQAIPAGHVDDNEIRVRARAGGEQVIVEVEDTGQGIPEAVIARIFDPFFTTKPVGLGTGLGLAISHEIVRALGGTITVTSRVGVGTMFRVVLPIATAQAEAAAGEPGLERNGTARVLVIDDEQAVGRSIALLLAPDYDVTAVTRAKEALAKIGAGERFDAIVCDVMMPEMTGIDFYAQLSPELRGRTLFLTGGAFTEQTQQFLANATRPHLDKPFSEQQLRRAIESVRTP